MSNLRVQPRHILGLFTAAVLGGYLPASWTIALAMTNESSPPETTLRGARTAPVTGGNVMLRCGTTSATRSIGSCAQADSQSCFLSDSQAGRLAMSKPAPFSVWNEMDVTGKLCEQLLPDGICTGEYSRVRTGARTHCVGCSHSHRQGCDLVGPATGWMAQEGTASYCLFVYIMNLY